MRKGQRVAVYGGLVGTRVYVEGHRGTVICNSKGLIRIEFDTPPNELGSGVDDGGEIIYTVHEKQCRKLKQKSRVIYVPKDKIKEFYKPSKNSIEFKRKK